MMSKRLRKARRRVGSMVRGSSIRFWLSFWRRAGAGQTIDQLLSTPSNAEEIALAFCCIYKLAELRDHSGNDGYDISAGESILCRCKKLQYAK
jgi:hypothetical protein